MPLISFREQYTAVLFGASGGIGGALLSAFEEDPRCARIWAGARSAIQPGTKTTPFAFDLRDEAGIAAIAAQVGEPDVVIVATGLLHDETLQPEKTYRALDPAALARAFEINAIGPALIAKHFLPLLPRGRKTAFAALSARVGSIGDNRKGGWHGYRASKAALNMLIRTCAIELAMRNRTALCVALHPGTVDTSLSKPFQAGVPTAQMTTPGHGALRLLQTLDALTPAESGGFFAYDGSPIPF